MPCPESKKAKLYLSGSLSKKQENSFQNHIENCPHCREQVENLLKHDTFLKELQSEYNQTYWHDASSAKDITISNFFLSYPGGTKIDVEFSPGQQLADRYRIIRKLGQKYTNVYHAFDMHLGHEVAIKLVATGPNRAGKAFGTLRQELLFRNPINDFTNVIKTYDIHPAEYEGLSLILLTMEYADGGSLRNWLNESRHNTRRITEGLALLEQACSAVKIIHNAGLIHRDIKPENILLCRNSNDFIVKLSDFGISCSLADISADSSQMVIAGTPLYMAPEQFVSDNHNIIGHVSDIYSLGIVIYEVLTGKPPFYGNFKELREKHLHQQPPKLSGDLHKWGQIIERCLQKDPASRYNNINELINDIGRLKKGLAISIDISCPQCGHVNSSIDTISCENCRKQLDSIFRLCPVCNRQVRLDVEHCPGCGKDVASYYTLVDRRQQIETLKDEDVVEAIRLLELVLREDAGDFHNRAVELVKDLRNKQLKINSLIELASKAEIACDPEKAIGFWNDVLQIIPRHKTAKQQLQRLRYLNTRFGKQWKQAVVSMDNGEFEEAEKLLEGCLKSIPNHDDIIKLLQDCRARASSYNQSLENALIADKSKSLLRAKKQVEIALIHAPQSLKAAKLQNDIISKLKKVDTLFHLSVEQFNQADFSQMADTFDRIEQIQSDSTFLSDGAKEGIFKNRDKYLELVKEAHASMNLKQLEKAEDRSRAALKICPKSVEIKELLNLIDVAKDKVRDLVQKAKSAILSARFEHAQELLAKATSLYSSLPQIHATYNTLQEAKNIYNHSKEKAGDFHKNGDLEQALQTANLALNICPDSEEMATLIKDIETDQRFAGKFLQDAQIFLISARFDKVSENIKKAKNLWRRFDLLSEIEAQAKQTADSFNPRMLSAKQYQKKGDLEKSLEACQGALEICPGSKEASALLKSIQVDQACAKEYIEQAKALLRSADFEKTREKIEAAKKIWPVYEKLSDVESQVKEVTENYNRQMSSSLELLEAKSLQDSLAACQAALKICHNSEKAKELLKVINKEIEADKAKRRRKKEIRTTIFDILFSPIYIPYTIIVTIAVFLAQHWQITLTVIVIAAVVGLIGYGGFMAWGWIAAHPKTVITLFIAVPVAALIIFRS